MKYAAHIQVIDGDGKVVHERVLTPEQIIDELLDRDEHIEITSIEVLPPASLPTKLKVHKEKLVEKFGGGATPKEKGYACRNCHKKGHNAKTCPEIIGTPKERAEAGEIRDCCGWSSRGRHKGSCSEAGKGKANPNRRTVDNRHAFSEPTWDRVKASLKYEPVDVISSSMGLELEEVRRANLSDDYQDYLTIA